MPDGDEGYPEIAILPMSDSDDEFKTYDIDELQRRYFLNKLPFKYSGKYNYRASGLNADRGTLVLFQFRSHIVATAVFLGSEKFEAPKGDYNGSLIFDSIRVFNPIDAARMKSIWPDDFPGFKQSKTRLNPDQTSAFEARLTGVQTPKLSVEDLFEKFDEDVAGSAELSEADLLARIANSDPMPSRREATLMVFIRNPDVVAYVLKRANGVCEVCKQPAPFIRRSGQTPYLEVHHTINLANDGPDTPDNAQALCPNCHREVHYG